MTTADLAEAFAALAEAVDARGSAVAIRTALERTHAMCEALSGQKPTAAVRQALEEAQIALRAWREVWPRLGAQHDFRAAVVREARGWATRAASLSPRGAS